jgi:hypothetical protein
MSLAEVKSDPEVAEASSLSIKLPPFVPDDPEMWFARVEATFRRRKISKPWDKFDYCLAAMSQDQLQSVRHVIVSPSEDDPYAELKAALIKRHSPDPVEKLVEFFDSSSIAIDGNPKLVADRIKALSVDATARDIAMFISKMPLSIRGYLLRERDTFVDVDCAAIAAEQLLRGQTPAFSNISAVKATSSSQPSRRGRVLCFYHRRWGKNAKQCRPPCQFKDDHIANVNALDYLPGNDALSQ